MKQYKTTLEEAYQSGIRHALMAAVHPAPWRRVPPDERRVLILDQEEADTTPDLLFDRTAYDELINEPDEE